MHVRVSRVSRNGKTYAYAQLVESYRRDDGMPAHRVVANLGALVPEQLANLKAALAATRNGERLASTAPGSAKLPEAPVANLAYLDLATLLELAHECGLRAMLDELLPRGQSTVPPSDIVVALALQRCVDPGSKLYAERWFPRTALPELLGLAPESFNNTRLHRVLDELDGVTSELMNQLPRLYLDKERAAGFATLYVDLTDAAFVGHGPPLAVRGKTKEGVIARKIGILLLCNERGYPLRWRVVEGNASDCTVMVDLFEEIASTPWAQRTPMICDRAMGRASLIRSMSATGLHFVTALASTEFEAFAPTLPTASFSDLDIHDDSADARASAIEQTVQRARATGMQRVKDTLWVLDLGLGDVGLAARDPLDINASAERSPVVQALHLATRVDTAVKSGGFTSFAAASRSIGASPNAVKKFRRLLGLPQTLRDRIENGDADGCTMEQMLDVIRAPAAEQPDRFEQLVQASRTRSSRRALPIEAPSASNAPLRVRVVVSFNPERFVDQRLTENRQRQNVAVFVDTLNRRLAKPTSRMRKEAIVATVDRHLRSEELLDAYKVQIAEKTTGVDSRFEVTLLRVEKAWERRRRAHGFSVLVAHPDVTPSAGQLCQLYRNKDRVEKDFQTIKSVFDLRPIRHRTDEKVRAHVTLCMLALLLERLLDRKLAGLCSAASALETLETCHLNRYRGTRGVSAYNITEPTAQQRALLRKLRLGHLTALKPLLARLSPRLHLQDERNSANSATS